MIAMDDVYREYSNMIFRYLLTLCGDEHLAEELTQEPFYQAVRSADRYDGTCKVTTWLCAIARNLFLDEKRRQTRTEQMPEEIPSKEKTPEQLTMDRDSSFRIHMALHALDEPYREAFELRVFGELSFREIGTIFGKTENWARVTYHRARLKLQERMNADEN